MKKILSAVFGAVLFLAACAGSGQPREVWLQNAQSETIYLQIDGYETADSGKLAVIQHGLASSFAHPAVQAAKQAFLDNGYLVITFDSRYSLGKSDGSVIDVRLSTFEDDLKTVLAWAKKQDFYGEPFALAGHSLGGASVLQYAAQNPALVAKVVPITPVVSGKRWEAGCLAYMPDFCKNWKKNGFYNYQTEVIPYAVVEEAMSYDAVRAAKDIRAQTLLITVADDHVIVPQDVKDLYQALGADKSLGVVSAGGHNFKTEQSRQDLYHLIAEFL